MRVPGVGVFSQTELSGFPPTDVADISLVAGEKRAELSLLEVVYTGPSLSSGHPGSFSRTGNHRHHLGFLCFL